MGIEKLGITPGPWEKGSHSSMELMVYCDDVAGSRIADCTNNLVRHTKEMKTANANLIAASPGLFDALVIDTTHDEYYLLCNFGPIDGTLRERMAKEWHKPGEMVYDDYMRKLTAILSACPGKTWEEIKVAYDGV